MRAAIFLVLMAVVLQCCADGKARSRIPDCNLVSANARPGVDCMNRG